MEPRVVLIRIGLAFLASFAFGLARQRSGKPIGFGTFTFLALGSCTLALTAIGLSPESPLPLLGAIVTGIGFLGAGALFRTGERVVGFTSAATLWIFAVLGLAIGVGEYLLAGLVYGSIWTVNAMDRWLENRWIGAHQRKLVVELPLETGDDALEELGLPVRASAQGLQLDREKGALVLTYSVGRPRRGATDPLDRLRDNELVRRVTIETA